MLLASRFQFHTHIQFSASANQTNWLMDHILGLWKTFTVAFRAGEISPQKTCLTEVKISKITCILHCTGALSM